jgi:Ca2+:H+ antiporter
VTAPPPRPRLGRAHLVFLGLPAFVPATVGAAWLHAATWVFALAALALVPLARWIGTAPEAVARHLGRGPGGLLNATSGNAAELIVAIAALNAGQTAVVKLIGVHAILAPVFFFVP